MPLRRARPGSRRATAFASSTMPGHVVAERRHLVGDRVGEQHADAGDQQDHARASDDSTASPRGKRARRSSVTNGFSSSAISPATMNSSSTGPAARTTAHSAEQRQRQQRRAASSAATTHAARTRGAVGRLLGRLGKRRHRSLESSRPPRLRVASCARWPLRPDASSSSATSSRSAGRRTLERAAPGPARGARARLRRRQRRERRGRDRHHAEGRRRAASPPAST